MNRLGPTSILVGPHEFQFVPPDEVHFAFRGEFNVDEVDEYLDFMFQWGDRCNGQLYACYDLSKFTRVGDVVRKRVVNVDRPYPLVGLAVIGATFATRTVAGMILTAGKLVAPQSFTFAVKFMPTVVDARAWFGELRKGTI